MSMSRLAKLVSSSLSRAIARGRPRGRAGAAPSESGGRPGADAVLTEQGYAKVVETARTSSGPAIDLRSG